MELTDFLTGSGEQTTYWATALTSSILCIVSGALLIFLHPRRRTTKAKIYPERYITARRMLGIAYCVIGALTLLQLATGSGANAAPKQSDFLPISGLVISTSQALLFTAALLALYNSRLVSRKIVMYNLIPIAWFVGMYVLFIRFPEMTLAIKKLFFCFYIVQLIGYSVVFFVERDKYLEHLDQYFDDWGCRAHRRNGVTALFLCSLGVGLAAMASYYFTELWHLTAFIAAYTVYYIAVAVYFLRYRRHSEEIATVTTPEEWGNEDSTIHLS